MKRKTLVGSAAAFACGAVLAYNFGAWFCEECKFAPVGSPVATFDLPDFTSFIKFNNDAIMRDGKRQGWLPNDLISVCDGTSCWTAVFKGPPGAWFPIGPPTRDTHRYKNATFSPSGDDGGSVTYAVGGVVSDLLTDPSRVFRTVTIWVGPISPAPPPPPPAPPPEPPKDNKPD